MGIVAWFIISTCGAVDELQHKRTTSDNARSSGQEIP